MNEKLTGGFTLPGESGQEALTLRLAKEWGADVIRDSDGTKLSPEILNAGYDIYSTICVIREHNAWAEKNPLCRQSAFLCTEPVTAEGKSLTIGLMDGFFSQQFEINEEADALKYMQVWDRTKNILLEQSDWHYGGGRVTLCAEPFHRYTVSFLVWRIWEEINMYNYTTNGWTGEHLIPIDPRRPEAQRFLLDWMEQWCKDHPDTNVVRFTSMFYNFVWIWGSDARSLYSDWASYDFTVSTAALAAFRSAYGYELTAEDFVHQGKLQVTHMPPTQAKLDYMAFTHDFVLTFGKKLIDIVHRYGKKAYVFYDDSWVGVEPYSSRFAEFGFDGLIKCVFSGFEARLCAGADVETHELRLHPYLFPVGLGGAPTFMEGGNPALDATKYWNSIRRALLRQPVDRIGLGGYLHLTEDFPDFQQTIQNIADEFRRIKALHMAGAPAALPLKAAVLHTWGSLRSWSLSGHFHETYMHDLIHINEALSGLPVDVEFLSFEDVKAGKLDGFQVVINAGRAGDAWSGGAAWEDDDLCAKLTEWVYAGGCLIGVNEPTAAPGTDRFFRMADVLGVDEDTGAYVCHSRRPFEVEEIDGLIPNGAAVASLPNRMLIGSKAKVLAAENGEPSVVINPAGKGCGIYLSSFRLSHANTRLLLNLMLVGSGLPLAQNFLTSNPETECAFYPASHTFIIVNESELPQHTDIRTPDGEMEFDLAPYETRFAAR